jgi:PAP_fibrillin
LLAQLEAQNPYPSLDKAGSVLDGQWKLVYTSNSELVALLALNRLPFFEVGDITQTIDSITLTAVNTVSLTVPFSRTSFSTKASFEIRSPKRLQVFSQSGHTVYVSTCALCVVVFLLFFNAARLGVVNYKHLTTPNLCGA